MGSMLRFRPPLFWTAVAALGETGGDTVLPQWAGEHPGQPEMVRKYRGLLVRRL